MRVHKLQVRLLAVVLLAASHFAVAKKASTPPDGIKVHGHWTIVVRDPDGKVVSRNEFDNALTTRDAGAGSSGLSQFLTRKYAVGTWEISLGSSTSSQEPCRTVDGTPVI